MRPRTGKLNIWQNIESAIILIQILAQQLPQQKEEEDVENSKRNWNYLQIVLKS